MSNIRSSRVCGVLLGLMLVMLNACGVGVAVNPTSQPTAATTAISAGQLSPADIQATVDAQVRATLAAQQQPTTAAQPSPGVQTNPQTLTAPAATTGASSPGVAPTSVATTAAAATEAVPTSAMTGATETVPSPATTGQSTENSPATIVAANSPCPPASGAESEGAPAPANTVAAATPPPALLLILDSSGSMLADDGTGKRKIDTAKAALNALVDELPEGASVGLRVYGHRVPNTDKANGCKDTELIVPVGPLNRQTMKTAINSFEATGFTPISTSLDEAAKDLPAEGERTIVLVSDGEETCDRDPCQAAKDLLAKGINVKIETVGFQVEALARSQLECIAQATGGEYRDVRNATDLALTLRDLSTRALKTYQTVGTVIRGGDNFNTAPQLTVGQYQDTIKINETLFYAIDLQAGQQVRVGTTIVGQPELGVVATVGTSVDLNLLDPLRQKISSDVTTSFGQETDTLVVASKPVLNSGRYYFSLGMRDNQPANREFKTELIIELIDANGENPCAALGGNLPSSQVAAPGPVQGGDSFNNALLVTSGQYQDTIKVNETLYYAVNLQKDQQLRVVATVTGQPELGTVETVGTFVNFKFYDTVRQEVGSDIASSFGQQTESFALELTPVLYGGRYYFSLGLRDNQPVNREFKTEFVVEIIGG